MHCPRLDHFLRFNSDGTISRCGHMLDPPKFRSLEDLESSKWLQDIKQEFSRDIWPKECRRCEEIEHIGQTSVRQHSIKRHNEEPIPNYFQVGGVLDNICNSACQFCSAALSTKIGSLIDKKTYPMIDNSRSFWNLPQDRIVMLDVNGGEPSASKNYKKLLENLPPNLKKLRINTNGSLIISGLDKIAKSGIEVTVTMSFDGMGSVHDYVRWPIKWSTFEKTLETYLNTTGVNLDLWTTVNALNVNSLDRLINYAQKKSINHSYALLSFPSALNICYKNAFTLAAKTKFSNSDDQSLVKLSDIMAGGKNNTTELIDFIRHNDQLRNIQIQDYFDDAFTLSEYNSTCFVDYINKSS